MGHVEHVRFLLLPAYFHRRFNFQSPEFTVTYLYLGGVSKVWAKIVEHSPFLRCPQTLQDTESPVRCNFRPIATPAWHLHTSAFAPGNRARRTR